MGAELHQNTTRRDIGLIDGFTIAPGEKRTLPWHVATHPLTKAHVKLGELAVVVPDAGFTPASPLPEGATVVDGDDVYKVGGSKRGKPSKRTAKAQDKADEPEAVEAEPGTPEGDKSEG